MPHNSTGRHTRKRAPTAIPTRWLLEQAGPLKHSPFIRLCCCIDLGPHEATALSDAASRIPPMLIVYPMLTHQLEIYYVHRVVSCTPHKPLVSYVLGD